MAKLVTLEMDPRWAKSPLALAHSQTPFAKTADLDHTPSFNDVNTLQCPLLLRFITNSLPSFLPRANNSRRTHSTMAGSLDAFKVFSASEKPDRVAASRKILEEYDRKKEQEQTDANDWKGQIAPKTTIEAIKKQDGEQKA